MASQNLFSASERSAAEGHRQAEQLLQPVNPLAEPIDPLIEVLDLILELVRLWAELDPWLEDEPDAWVLDSAGALGVPCLTGSSSSIPGSSPLRSWTASWIARLGPEEV